MKYSLEPSAGRVTSLVQLQEDVFPYRVLFCARYERDERAEAIRNADVDYVKLTLCCRDTLEGKGSALSTTIFYLL